MALGINRHGHVAVGVETANGEFSGIYNGKKLLDLGTLRKSVRSQPASINDLDPVVGTWYGQVWGAYLHTDGRMHDLSSLVRLPAGWALIDPQNGGGGPQSINDRGVIVGNGLLNGEPHADKLVPVTR